ncbi:MAG: glycosyltransferase [Lachnospiraceae bacterium]|nr:glycosyltransferase [Lachnospiraceae bacterium]
MPAKYGVVIVTYNRVQLLKECVAQTLSQSVRPAGIIIVNNASTDDTKAYLESIDAENNIEVINLSQNIGGAGGFTKGMNRALQKDVDCILMIDDDAMMSNDYMEKVLKAREQHPQYRAFAGVVETKGQIDPFHRRNLVKPGLMTRNVRRREYKRDYFTCDSASFCGMVVDTELIRQIGLPHSEYFIYFDDTEYSLRIRRYSKFLVIVDAKLNHKAETSYPSYPRRYGWKDYYAVRNRLLMVKEHGNVVDRIINFTDIFIHIIFRNWWFGLIKRDHYDWKYEQNMVKAAVQDSENSNFQNVIISRKGQGNCQIEYSEIHKSAVK